MNENKTVINGWTVYYHDLFNGQFEALIEQVEELKQKFPDTFHKKAASKLLAAIFKVIHTEICADPMHPKFRQGETLGVENKHWFRAKFLGQFRLFFRYSEQAKTIILVWVNDESTKRAYGHKNDAYKVFSAMLAHGYPPASWDDLLTECRSQPFIDKLLVVNR